MNSLGLPKNPLFAFLLIFLGIIFLSYVFKIFVDEGFAAKVSTRGAGLSGQQTATTTGSYNR